MNCSTAIQLKTIYSETIKSLNTLDGSSSSELIDYPQYSKLALVGYANLFNPSIDYLEVLTNNVQFSIEYLERGNTVLVESGEILGNFPDVEDSIFIDEGYGLGYLNSVTMLNNNTAIQQADITFFATPRAMNSGDPYGYGIKYNHNDTIKLVLKTAYVEEGEIPAYVIHYYYIYLNKINNIFVDGLSDEAELIEFKNNSWSPTVESATLFIRILT